MKKLILSIMFNLLIGIFLCSAQEITLFDSDGEPKAYIDADDKEIPIYLWNGEPVAYLEPVSRYDYYNVYGFNGKHLGWFEGGLVIDHEGYVVGFIEGAVNKYTKYEPYKSYKKYLPYKSYTQYEPYKPNTKSYFSSTPLVLFLSAGKK